jgi:DNA topoisomerase-6 subunit A
MATPEAKFIGVRSRDFERCGLSEGVKISLSDIDRKRAKQIAEYPWFAHKKDWQKEVEALVSRSISYMTEEYVPRLLKEGDFLD